MTVYKDPQFEKGYVFAARRLPGAVDVPRTLKDTNMDRREVSDPLFCNRVIISQASHEKP